MLHQTTVINEFKQKGTENNNIIQVRVSGNNFTEVTNNLV